MKKFLGFLGVMTSVVWGPLLMMWIVIVTILAIPHMLTKKALS